MTRIWLTLLTLTFLCTRPVVVFGDLYTGSGLSLDWVVDSADRIIHVAVEHSDEDLGNRSPSDKKNLVVQHQDVLKEVANVATTNVPRRTAEHPPIYRVRRDDDGVARFQLRRHGADYFQDAGKHCHRPAEWLLLTRDDGDKEILFYAINLTRPREQSYTAALTQTGEALTSRDAILTAVTKRVSQKRHLPETTNRDVIDRWADHSGGVREWYEKTRERDYFLSDAIVAEVLGGFSIAIDNDYWDSPDPDDSDEDLLLIGLIVPADETHRKTLMDNIRSAEYPSEESILALLNYPDQETEKFLEETAKRSVAAELLAPKMRTYLKYRRAVAPSDRDPLDERLTERLAGKWIIQGPNETVFLNLHNDRTCQIDTRPSDATKNSGYRPVNGRGYWAVNDGELWLVRSHVEFDDKWRVNVRQFFPPRRLLEVSAERVRIDRGPTLHREAQQESGVSRRSAGN